MGKRSGKALTAVQAIKLAVRQAEQVDLPRGDEAIGATGYTLLRLQVSPVAKLVDQGLIGPEELQAARDINTAFVSLVAPLMLRPLSWERLDRSRANGEPVAVLEAQRRYIAFANHWSREAKLRNDWTLAAIIGVVIHEWSFQVMDEKKRGRNGTARRLVIVGLRDYAVRAGWVKGKLAEEWSKTKGKSHGRYDQNSGLLPDRSVTRSF